MIRLNCTLLIEESKNRQPLIDLATELVELSLHDKGCITYDLYGSLTNDDHLMIVETWDNKKSLDAHMKSDHFKRIVPQLQELSTMTLEEFTF
ncbi:MAG: antibiotic biosynthesis monooxygenase [Lachnoclostridium sp.]|nr:antibiotic biosynthesis monooxygenase [Lachnoclostridium sp.]